jgi:hypothetical protein
MRLLDLIFALIFKFVPIKEQDFAKLKSEAEADWATVRTDDEAELNLKAKIKKYTDKWESRLIMAISYIFLVRWITDFMNPKDSEEEEKED